MKSNEKSWVCNTFATFRLSIPGIISWDFLILLFVELADLEKLGLLKMKKIYAIILGIIAESDFFFVLESENVR